MLRVTADTNILVSGLNFLGGKPFQFLSLARAGKINLGSDVILMRWKTCFGGIGFAGGHRKSQARQAMARTVNPVVTLDVIKEDPLTTVSRAVAAPTTSRRVMRPVAAEEL